MKFKQNLSLLVCGSILSSPCMAFAWDPNAGADSVPKPSVAHYQPMTATVTYPQVIQSSPMPPTPAPAAVSYPPIVYTPPAAPVATAAPAPAASSPPPAPVYVAPAPIVAPVYAAAPTAVYTPPAKQDDRLRPNRFAIGVEGFYDRYQEPIADLDSRAGYGSLTGEYAHYFSPEWFSEVDGRASYGHEHYHSISGTIDGVPQWEFDGRLLAGYDIDYLHGRRVKPYLGFGTRYYVDDGKGRITDTGYYAYDRRILQFYMPVGMAFEFPGYGLQWASKLEFDPLLYGHVDTRFQNLNYYEINNDQHSGSGWRGELLVGQTNSQGLGWQAGPFLRYWNMRDSKTTTDPNGIPWEEPHNTRLQAGATLKFLF